MGPALVQQARAIHEEIEDAPDVSEEDLVEMVWHESSHADDEPSLRNEGDASHPDTDTVTDEPSTRDAMVAAIASDLEKEMAEWRENSKIWFKRRMCREMHAKAIHQIQLLRSDHTSGE